MTDIRISDIANQYSPIADSNTRIEVAVPNPASPTLFDTYYIKVSDLASFFNMGPLFIDADGNQMVLADTDTGHQYVILPQVQADLAKKPGFNRGFK